MKTVRIYYFSGTGNTELVSRCFETELGRLGCEVSLVRMEELLKAEAPLELSDCDLIGIGSPVVGYGAPALVYRFLRKLPKARGQKVFIFRTAGGVAPINYGASAAMRRILEHRGYEVFHERLFSIGSNWIVRFSNDAMRRLRDASAEKVALMCRELVAGAGRRMEVSLGMSLLMGPVRFLASIFLRLMAKDLRVGSDCSRCGLCVRSCPAGNISETGGAIRFGADCSSCLRCVYNCPRRAIGFKTLSFFPVKGGYDLAKILAHPEACPDAGTKANPPFLAQYLENAAY